MPIDNWQSYHQEQIRATGTTQNLYQHKVQVTMRMSSGAGTLPATMPHSEAPGLRHLSLQVQVPAAVDGAVN